MSNAAYTVSTAWTVVNTKTGDVQSGQDEDYFATVSECKAFVESAIGQAEKDGHVAASMTLDGDGAVIASWATNTPHIITSRMFYVAR